MPNSDKPIRVRCDFVSSDDLALIYHDTVYPEAPVLLIVIGAPWLAEKLRHCLDDQKDSVRVVGEENRKKINYVVEAMTDFCFISAKTEKEADAIYENILKPLIESAPPSLRSKVSVITSIHIIPINFLRKLFKNIVIIISAAISKIQRLNK